MKLEARKTNAYTSLLIKKEVEGIEADLVYAVRKLLENPRYKEVQGQSAIADCLIVINEQFNRAKERLE
jgi:hypothetical protein